jgi:hypothetical protein
MEIDRGGDAVTDLTNDQLRRAILRALNENAKSFADAAKARKARVKPATKARRSISKRRLLKTSGSRGSK